MNHERFIVQPQFKKYDTDGSKSLEYEELERLILDFGIQLDAEEVHEALKDMDTNGDKSVDYDEFCRWYFSGMKLTSKGKRVMK